MVMRLLLYPMQLHWGLFQMVAARAVALPGPRNHAVPEGLVTFRQLGLMPN
jgi:hypothetical protein